MSELSMRTPENSPSLARIRIDEHKVSPQYIEMFRRYQCHHCHSWIAYDEHFGTWLHLGRMQEEMKGWSWNGFVWSRDKEPQP